jgi:hypothetical protein
MDKFGERMHPGETLALSARRCLTHASWDSSARRRGTHWTRLCKELTEATAPVQAGSLQGSRRQTPAADRFARHAVPRGTPLRSRGRSRTEALASNRHLFHVEHGVRLPGRATWKHGVRPEEVPRGTSPSFQETGSTWNIPSPRSSLPAAEADRADHRNLTPSGLRR